MARSNPSKRGFSIISLIDPLTASVILRNIGLTAGSPDNILGRLGRNPELQHEVLTILCKFPETQRRVMIELAKDPHFRRRLMVFAGQHTEGRPLRSRS
jgi:hypothetical protein